MKIPTFNASRARPWMRKRPRLARLFCIAILPFAPLIFATAILWENRSDFAEMGVIVKAAFLPWKTKP